MREIRSFVVRIYRKGRTQVAGVVEDVQTGCIHSFHGAVDLWQVLTSKAEEETPKGSQE